MGRFFGFVASIALVAGVAGCAPPDVSGSWSGSWRVGILTNSLTMTLTQSGTTVTGSSTVGGTFCVPNGNLTATVSRSPDKLNGSFTNNIGNVTFDADINAAVNHLSGTFTATGTGCNGTTTGSFDLDREGS